VAERCWNKLLSGICVLYLESFESEKEFEKILGDSILSWDGKCLFEGIEWKCPEYIAEKER